MVCVGPGRAQCRQGFFSMSCFICSTFVPGLACYSLQWRFFPSLWEFTVSWETCLDLYLKKKSEMHWYFWFYKTFSTHESSILATLVAACLFPDFMFYFHSHRWCDFCLCGILPNLKQHVGGFGSNRTQEFSLLKEAVLEVFLVSVYLQNPIPWKSTFLPIREIWFA